MPTWIQQPPKSRVCGQIAVAVIADITLEEAIKIVGKKGCTKTKDLVKALRKLRYNCPIRCRKFKLPFPPIAIAKMKPLTRKTGWHWIAIIDGRIYDGIHGNADGTINWGSDCRITSLLPITKKI